MRIDGKFEGEIKTEEDVVIGESGRVKTNIHARTVIVAGTVIGNINVSEEVKLLGTGRVYGNINTPTIIIEKGVIADGHITITNGKSDNIKKLIDDHFSIDKSKQKDIPKEVK